MDSYRITLLRYCGILEGECTNVTFANECEFYRMKCLCQKGEDECEQRRYRNAHLEYYGACTGTLAGLSFIAHDRNALITQEMTVHMQSMQIIYGRNSRFTVTVKAVSHCQGPHLKHKQ